MGVSTLNVFDNANQFRLLMSFYAVIEESGVIPNCTNAPELFFPDVKSVKAAYADAETAKRACKNCPLMDACATYAIVGHEREGIWGGLSGYERMLIRKDIIDRGETKQFAQKGYIKYVGIKPKVPQVPRSVSELE
jgi:WhiB family redox-sensing transcriptional regulator